MIKAKRKIRDGTRCCGKKINRADDSFSYLPDNVFTVIFSFLTMKEALYACISCKKLKHLMTLIPNVEFKERRIDHTENKKFVQTVSRFLQNHDGLVKKFQLSFCRLQSAYWSDVCYWLSLVVKNGIEELDLMLNSRRNMIIPPSLLTAATLRVLRLRHCSLDQTNIAGFKSLKSLLLGSIIISDSVMDLITFHCESLLHLTLENCSGFTVIQAKDRMKKLETLIMRNCCIDDLFRLNVVSLKEVFIRLRTMNFSFVGSPHIDNMIVYREANIRIYPLEYVIVDNMIESLGNVKSLQLAGCAFECFTEYRGNHQLTKLEEILLLDFNVCLKNVTTLTYLISQAVGVNKLLIWINENSVGDHGIYTDRNFESVPANILDNEYIEQPTVALSNNTSLRNNHIRIVNILGFKGTIYELAHIKFMLANFGRLRLFKVTMIKDINEDQSRAYAKLISRYPRVSADVDMIVGSEDFNLIN